MMNNFESAKANNIRTSLQLSSSTARQERNLKGKSLIGIADNYVVIDIETTGLDVLCDEIIEVAAAKVEGGIIVDKFTSLIKPENRINNFIMGLTGINNEMVETAPPAEVALQSFVDFVGDSLLIGHNVTFDINFLYDNCQKKIGHNLSNNFLDTLRLSRMLFVQEKQHKLADLINRFGIGRVVEHRALGDVLQTQKCYEYMLGYSADHAVKLKHLGPQVKSSLRGRRKVRGNIVSEMENLFAELKY